MAKRKHLNPQIIQTPETRVGKTFRTTSDLSDREWNRRVQETRKPSIGYRFSAFLITILAILMGVTKFRTQGLTLESSGYLFIGLILSTLIIIRLLKKAEE